MSFENFRIIIERADGGITVICPASNAPQKSIDEIVARVLSASPDFYAGAVQRRLDTKEEFDASLLPTVPSGRWELEGNVPAYKTDHNQRRYYRNSWTWKSGKGIHKNPVIVKEIDDANIREVRDVLLKASDIDVMPDRGPVSPEMVAYRRDLRDVPQQQVAHKDIVWPVKP